MAVQVVLYLVAGGYVELGVERVLRRRVHLELLHLVRLTHPAEQYAAHRLDRYLAELIGATLVAVHLCVALTQRPDGNGTIDCVSHVADIRLILCGARRRRRSGSRRGRGRRDGRRAPIREDRKEARRQALILDQIVLH